MKRIFIAVSLVIFLSAKAGAPIFSCNDGIASFISYAPLEVIKAKSNHMRGAIDPGARTCLFVIRVNTFQGFNSGLQQEHFNENYLESEKFPEASFRGKLVEDVDLRKDGTYAVRAKGMLTLHGVQQERIINGTIEVKSGTMHIHSQFSILLEDHNITVPRIVHQKISPEMEVTIDAILRPVK
jgi:YceI-like domain